MLGLSIDIPNLQGDQTGLGWLLNDDNTTYSGFSYYWDNVNQEAALDVTWLCDAVPDEKDAQSIQGYCYNFMPKASNPKASY